MSSANKPGINDWFKNRCGLYLHEIIIIVAILLLLVAIAIPDFLKYSVRYPQAEAKTNLGALFTRQMAYYDEYKTYAGGPDCFKLLNWTPEGETIYTFWCDRDMIGPTKPGVLPSLCKVQKAVTSASSFTLCAAGNGDKDAFVDEWIITDSKNLANIANDLGN